MTVISVSAIAALFFKPVGFRVMTENGLVPIMRLSKLVQSLRKAEEDRMRVLVLAEEGAKEERGEEIGRLALSALQRKPRAR